MISQALSISAWNAVLLCPSIVAALSVWRHGPARSSAARRNTPARASNRQLAHSRWARLAAWMAAETARWSAWWATPSCWLRLWGATTLPVLPVATHFPLTIAWISVTVLPSRLSSALSAARSAEPGAEGGAGPLGAGGGVGGTE